MSLALKLLLAVALVLGGLAPGAAAVAAENGAWAAASVVVGTPLGEDEFGPELASGSTLAAKSANNPLVREVLKRGQEAHKLYNPGPTYRLDVRLPSGRRPDAVDLSARIVRELKPNNPRASRLGERQVERYRQELQEIYGGEWKGVVDTYP